MSKLTVYRVILDSKKLIITYTPVIPWRPQRDIPLIIIFNSKINFKYDLIHPLNINKLGYAVKINK